MQIEIDKNTVIAAEQFIKIMSGFKIVGGVEPYECKDIETFINKAAYSYIKEWSDLLQRHAQIFADRAETCQEWLESDDKFISNLNEGDITLGIEAGNPITRDSILKSLQDSVKEGMESVERLGKVNEIMKTVPVKNQIYSESV